MSNYSYWKSGGSRIRKHKRDKTYFRKDGAEWQKVKHGSVSWTVKATWKISKVFRSRDLDGDTCYYASDYQDFKAQITKGALKEARKDAVFGEIGNLVEVRVVLMYDAPKRWQKRIKEETLWKV